MKKNMIFFLVIPRSASRFKIRRHRHRHSVIPRRNYIISPLHRSIMESTPSSSSSSSSHHHRPPTTVLVIVIIAVIVIVVVVIVPQRPHRHHRHRCRCTGQWTTGSALTSSQAHWPHCRRRAAAFARWWQADSARAFNNRPRVSVVVGVLVGHGSDHTSGVPAAAGRALCVVRFAPGRRWTGGGRPSSGTGRVASAVETVYESSGRGWTVTPLVPRRVRRTRVIPSAAVTICTDDSADDKQVVSAVLHRRSGEHRCFVDLA